MELIEALLHRVQTGVLALTGMIDLTSITFFDTHFTDVQTEQMQQTSLERVTQHQLKLRVDWCTQRFGGQMDGEPPKTSDSELF